MGRWFVLAGLSLALACEANESPNASQAPPVAGGGFGGAAGGGAPAPPVAGAPSAAGAGSAAPPVPDAGSSAAGAQGGAGLGAGGTAGSAAGAGGSAGTDAAGAGGSAGAGAGGAGASGSGGGGEGGGDAGFEPCPQSGDPCKLLPLGDSITVGLGGAQEGGGYRVPLFRKALEADQNITYVGSLMNGPSMVDGVAFPRSYEGHSGRTIDFIAGRVPDPALADGPHIILLMIGTNDMYMQPNGAPERLAALLDEILGLLPESLLVVAQLTPFPGSDAQVQTYNAAIPPIVEERASRGEHILLVDMYTDFPTSLLSDGIHPNAEGYELMADRWYAAIAEFLPAM